MSKDTFPDGLGIPRAQMPQIAKEFISDFLKELQDGGTAVRRQWETADTLKPTQKELDQEKARGMGGVPEPVIVSSDSYLLDGHHRWWGLMLKNPQAKIEVFRVDLPIEELLKSARMFQYVSFKKIGESLGRRLRKLTLL